MCHAGSLLAAFTQVEDDFKKQHPTAAIADTSGGSVDLVRRFASGRLECDVIAPADHLVIDTMLKPARLADYTIVFASGRMVLAYSAADSKAKALTVSGSPYRYAASPPGIDLSDAHARYDVSVTIPGLGTPGAPASVTIPASAVEWGLTIPANSRHRELAIAFVASLIGTVGRASLTANGPAPIVPARVSVPDQARLPMHLRSLTAAK